MRTVYNSPIAFRHCRTSQVKQFLNGDIAYQASLVSGRHNIKPVNPQSGRVTLLIFPVGEADRVLGFSSRLFSFRGDVNRVNTIDCVRNECVASIRFIAFDFDAVVEHAIFINRNDGFGCNRLIGLTVHIKNGYIFRIRRFIDLVAFDINILVILNTIQNGITIRDGVAIRRAHASFSHKVANGHVTREGGADLGGNRIDSIASGNAIVHRAFPEIEVDGSGFGRLINFGALNVNNHIILNTIQNGIAIRDSVAIRRAHASFSHKVANGHVARQSGTNGAYHRINRVTSVNAAVHRAFPEVERNLFGRRLFICFLYNGVNLKVVFTIVFRSVTRIDFFSGADRTFVFTTIGPACELPTSLHRNFRGGNIRISIIQDVGTVIFCQRRLRILDESTMFDIVIDVNHTRVVCVIIACSKRRNRNANAKHQHCYTARQQTTKLFRFLHVITPFFKYLFQPLQPRPHV